MRTIAHLSDLHFGATDPDVVEGAVRAVAGARPDLVVVSGDVTQRARTHQFRAARAFLDRLPRPQIVVPGNHDVPLWNVFARTFSPLMKYRRIITPDLEPFHGDVEIAAVGLNTARSLTFKDGRLNQRQVAAAVDRFAAASPTAIKILVTHHPFDQPEAASGGDIVGRAAMAMTALAAVGIDLILSGHMHLAVTGGSATRYPGSAALLVQAGTATSHRRRGDPNSFNLLRIDRGTVAIERMDWSNGGFALAAVQCFAEGEEGWIEADANGLR